MKIGVTAMLLSVAGSAHALQPLETFLQRAQSHAFDAREAALTTRQREEQQEAALGRLLPAFSAQGQLTHNQYAAEIPANTFPGQTQAQVITPENQLDGILRVDVPLIDLANYSRYAQAKHLSAAGELQQQVAGLDLDRAVAQHYFTFVGASALMDAAVSSVRSAQENLDYVSTRRELGTATELDQERARAAVERAKQDVADAELMRIRSARNLETFTGVTPTPVTEYRVDDLRREAPLETWLQARDTPQERLQRELGAAADESEAAARRALLPTLSASAQERFTNATGFTGQSSAYQLQATLSWRLDFATPHAARAEAAAAELQRVRAERTQRAVQDSIFDAYHRVEAGLVKSAAARAQVRAAMKASELALERYQIGVTTQLDVTQSQWDAFKANAASIQADADLAFARVLLRLAAAKPPTMPESASPSVSAGTPTAPRAEAAPPTLPDHVATPTATPAAATPATATPAAATPAAATPAAATPAAATPAAATPAAASDATASPQASSPNTASPVRAPSDGQPE